MNDMTRDYLLQYLFQHKRCPLGSFGSLELVDGNATAWHAERKIMAPVPFVLFSHTQSGKEDLAAYLSAEESLSLAEAERKLNDFEEELKSLKPGEEIDLSPAGVLFADADGKLSFRQESLPLAYFPEIKFRRVEREAAVHQVVVGDTETTSEEMAGYFHEQASRKKDSWWVWAAILFLLAISATGWYLYNGQQGFFGNGRIIQPAAEPAGYTNSQ